MPSDPNLAITPPSDDTSSDVNASPDSGSTVTSDNSTSTTGGSDDQQRNFHIAFRLPSKPAGDHRVRIDVIDNTGTSLVYDEMHHAGDKIDVTEPGIGSTITVRIFVDDALMKQQIL
jgi:hypothetical protein